KATVVENRAGKQIVRGATTSAWPRQNDLYDIILINCDRLNTMQPATTHLQTPPTDIHDAELRRRVSPGALRTWLAIARQWRLTDVQAARLLGAPLSTYRRWKRASNVTLDAGQIERVSLLLGIYKDLELLLPRAEAADGWVKRR